MILRTRQYLSFIFVIALNVIHAKAFDCSVTAEHIKFDLTSLAGERVLNRTRETPPTTMVDSLRFNLCADLEAQGNLPDQDQCGTGTRVCMTKINKKDNEEDRITAVIPIVRTDTSEPQYNTGLSPKFISLLFSGPDYPLPSTPFSKPQSLNLTVLCHPSEALHPTFVAYDGSQLFVEWASPAGCPFEEGGGNKDDDKKDDKKEEDKAPDHESVGSGLGWFFLAILLCLAAYFGLGAYYNYSTYGARGADLIPHRDFWKEVPYMLGDVVSHLCSNIRPRRTSSRGGYISV
jgi:hypothetical protein